MDSASNLRGLRKVGEGEGVVASVLDGAISIVEGGGGC